MSTIDEKRTFADRTGATDVFVASAIGVVRVRASDGIVGEFGLVERCDARDVTASWPPTERLSSGDRGSSTDTPILAVATGADVLVGMADHEAAGGARIGFEATDFGPAVAVGFHEGTLLAAGPDGALARRVEGSWERIDVDSPLSVRAIDGDLIGTDRGVYRVSGTDRSHGRGAVGLSYAGLSGVRDVSAAGVPLAATGEGLYVLGNGWIRVVDGPADAVAAAPESDPGSLTRAYAATGTTLLSRDDGTWDAVTEADDPITAVAVDESVYAVTGTGTVLSVGSDGRRSQSIGVPDVTAVAIPPRPRAE